MFCITTNLIIRNARNSVKIQNNSVRSIVQHLRSNSKKRLPLYTPRHRKNLQLAARGVREPIDLFPVEPSMEAMTNCETRKINKSVKLVGPKKFEIVEQTVPELSPTDVLIQMLAVGLCTEDLQYYQNFQSIGDNEPKPFVLGHDGVGRVVEVGKEVRNVDVGSLVAVEPAISCGLCWYCQTGDNQLCPAKVIRGMQSVDGLLQQYVVHPHKYLCTLPDDIPLERAVCIGTATEAVHACRRVGIELGSNIVILGLSAIGLALIKIAEHMGALSITCVDQSDLKLEMARELGADKTLQSEISEEIVDRVRCLSHDIGPSVTFDCIGTRGSIGLATKLTRTGGSVAMLHVAEDSMCINLNDIIVREIDLISSFMHANEFELTKEFIVSYNVPLENLISHVFRIGDLEEAFETGISSNMERCKIMVLCQEWDTPKQIC